MLPVAPHCLRRGYRLSGMDMVAAWFVFGGAGAGWDNTITNEYPFHRIDQIWLSPNLRPLRVRAYRTQHSDHRIVMCEVRLQ
ncbi:MAG: hypothetical protein ACP5RN_10320 [Armatimonadota bacterium]